jgi:hypothetical protein
VDDIEPIGAEGDTGLLDAAADRLSGPVRHPVDAITYLGGQDRSLPSPAERPPEAGLRGAVAARRVEERHAQIERPVDQPLGVRVGECAAAERARPEAESRDAETGEPEGADIHGQALPRRRAGRQRPQLASASTTGAGAASQRKLDRCSCTA